MYGGVSLGVVEPVAVVDMKVGGLLPYYHGKSANGYVVVTDKVTVVLGNVVNNLILRRISVGPLRVVATLPHRLSTVGYQLHYSRQVVGGGGTDGVINIWCDGVQGIRRKV